MSESTVTVHRLAELAAQENVEVVDVRTPVEFREVHARIATNVPLDRLHPDAVMEGRNGTRAEPLYLMCRSGERAKMARERFLAAGHDNVVVVEGGTMAWVEAELPVERGKKAISLERQVRIAAGAIVLLGSVLGFFAHRYFLAIPAFVGAGLIFAGITNTCGMGMLLARMPWNQASECTSSSCER